MATVVKGAQSLPGLTSRTEEWRSPVVLKQGAAPSHPWNLAHRPYFPARTTEASLRIDPTVFLDHDYGI